MMSRHGLVVEFTGLRGFLNRGVFHHPVSRASACGLLILRRCMVRHLRFLLSLASRPLSQMNYLRARCVFCASIFLGIPVTLDLRVLRQHFVSFTCLGFFCQSHRSAFSGRSRSRFLGVSLSLFGALS